TLARAASDLTPLAPLPYEGRGVPARAATGAVLALPEAEPMPADLTAPPILDANEPAGQADAAPSPPLDGNKDTGLAEAGAPPSLVGKGAGGLGHPDYAATLTFAMRLVL